MKIQKGEFPASYKFIAGRDRGSHFCVCSFRKDKYPPPPSRAPLSTLGGFIRKIMSRRRGSSFRPRCCSDRLAVFTSRWKVTPYTFYFIRLRDVSLAPGAQPNVRAIVAGDLQPGVIFNYSWDVALRRV